MRPLVRPVETLYGVLEGSSLARWRQEALIGLVTELDRLVEAWQADSLYQQRKIRDLKRHLRDRDQHIANLEAVERDRLGVG